MRDFYITLAIHLIWGKLPSPPFPQQSSIASIISNKTDFCCRTNPQVLNYLEAENKYTTQVMQPTLKLQEAIYSELAGRIPKSDIPNPPQLANGFWYYSYRVPTGQYMVLARCVVFWPPV